MRMRIWLVVQLREIPLRFLCSSKQVSSSFSCYTPYVCKANQMSPIELNFNRFNPRIAFELSSTLNQIDKIIKLLCTRTKMVGSFNQN